MKGSKHKNILFITGCFISNACWDNWQLYFQGKGYYGIAPAWPHKKGSAAMLRSQYPDGNPALTGLTLNELIDYYECIALGFDEKPVIIGHSLGGLITQVLVNRGVAAAGVAIHSVQPAGILPYESPLFKLGWKFLGLFSSLNKSYLMTFKEWQDVFMNGMLPDEQRAGYEKYVIPESKRVNRGVFGYAAHVDFRIGTTPLLITAGSADQLIPATLNRRNFLKYKKSNSQVIAYKGFAKRNHFVLGQDGWEEVADFIIGWLGENVDFNCGKETESTISRSDSSEAAFAAKISGGEPGTGS